MTTENLLPNLPALDALYLERTRFLESGTLAANTLSGYGYDWRAFTAWTNKLSCPALPASTETVSLYITDELRRKQKVSSVRRKVAAIAHMHRRDGLDSPVTPEIRKLLKGAKRLRNESLRQVRPLTVADLLAISGALRIKNTGHSLRNRAILVVGFASSLRSANLAMLLLEDVESTERGYILHIRREKQDQQQRGRWIGLPPGKNMDTCPVRCLTDWLRVRKPGPGPLFTRMHKRDKRVPIQPERICFIVKACVKSIGLDPRYFGSHSMRSGFITAAGEAGAGTLLIASQTGHRDMRTLEGYFRRTNLFRSNASTLIGL
jgi:site-specific recombinase XerD